MISGNPDERMAFVLETESHLDGIRKGRAEITGLGTDADALGGRLAQMSAKSKAAFDAMTAAEQKAFLGFIGVKDGAKQATAAIEQETAAVQRNTAATTAMANPAFAAAQRRLRQENAATAQSFDPVSGKARSAANAMSMLSFQAAGLTAGGQSTVIAMGSLTSSLAHLSSSAALAAGASGIGALVVIAATLIPLLSKMANESERVAGGFGKAFGGVGDEGAEQFLQLARQRRAAAQTALENAPSALSPMQSDVEARKNRKAALDEAVKDEQTAIEAVFAARRNAQRRAKEEAKQLAEEVKRDREKTNDLYFGIANERALAGMRGSGNQEGADIHQVEIDRVNREREINQLKISEDEKADLRARSREASEARITEIQNKYADERIRKSDEESRKADEIDRRRAAKRLGVARANVHAIVEAEGPLGQTLKRLALEPIVSELEGIAAREAVKAIASWPNPLAMAKHGAAALAATAAAREVAGWAGGGSKGGGSAGSGAGGPGAGTFEPRNSTEGQGSVVVNLYSQNPYGEEQIQQLQWNLERGGIMKRGARIPPTNQLRVA